jgi:hypothetical protein
VLAHVARPGPRALERAPPAARPRLLERLGADDARSDVPPLGGIGRECYRCDVCLGVRVGVRVLGVRVRVRVRVRVKVRGQG